ncbi:MAG: nuclease-related domain-containing protein [Anaerolineaceae bacterium]|nr:nuclease-related domain-containing protein [Anaerolineaceae bacterium]
MSNKYGSAGKSIWDMAARRRRNAVIYAVIGVLLMIILVCLLQNPKAFGIGGIGILVLLGALKILPDVLDRVLGGEIKMQKRAERGAVGEEVIGEFLDELDETYITLHDIECPYGNIDHIVLSKEKGIFLIETKSHRGKVEIVDGELLLNGHAAEKDFIGQVLQNTYWLREQVKEVTGADVWIHTLLVFTNAFVVFEKPLRGVQVLNKKYLISTLESTRSNPAEAAKIWSAREEITAALCEGDQEPAEDPVHYESTVPAARKKQSSSPGGSAATGGFTGFLSDFLRNLAILVACGLALFLLFPAIMGQVFSLFGALLGPLAIILFFAFALPRRRRRRRNRYE